jgi:hypothetical protein
VSSTRRPDSACLMANMLSVPADKRGILIRDET